MPCGRALRAAHTMAKLSFWNVTGSLRFCSKQTFSSVKMLVHDCVTFGHYCSATKALVNLPSNVMRVVYSHRVGSAMYLAIVTSVY